MPYYVDTHAHIYVEEFDEDIDEVLARADAADVRIILLPNIDSTTTHRMKSVCNRSIMAYPMMGVHPCSVQPDTYKAELAHVKQELDAGFTSEHGKSYVAAGEIGIDLHWDTSTLTIQTEAFEQQMLWAHEKELPVAVHCRSAYDEVISSIANMGNNRPKGVLHCFTGNLNQAEQLIELGFKLGIGGVVTYKNSGLDKVVAQLALEHLILETDSPYLPPTPHRGSRNEPSYVPIIAKKIADIKGVDMDQIRSTTMQNAHDLFQYR